MNDGSDAPKDAAAPPVARLGTDDSTVLVDVSDLDPVRLGVILRWCDEAEDRAKARTLPVAEPLTGLDRAIANASSWDGENFRAAVSDRAERPGAFTIEDVLDETGVPLDHQNRVGALTANLARQGVIVRVGYTKAKRASRAGAVVAVWRGARWSQ